MKNLNVFALKGYDVLDTELAIEHGVDPALAGTKEMNEQILQKVKSKNREIYMKQGMSEKKAEDKAHSNYVAARRDIDALYKKHGI